MDQQELQFWLETDFQNKIEVSLQKSRAGAPEETPYVHKYEAIELLKSLLQTEHPYHFIPYVVLGEIYNEVEQTSDSVRSYEAALLSMQKLPSAQTWKYYHYLIVVYNNLGLSNLNRDENETGLGCLARAEQVYQAFKEVPGENVYHNRSYEPKGRTFHLLYEGGIDHEQIEDSYTLTLFYLAQAYTKIGLKDKAAESCGLTLQRQYSTGKYQLKEFVNNLIGLAECYQGNKYYAQGQYILMLASKVIPEGKKIKLQATVHIAIGNLIGELLEFGCQRISNNDFGENDNELVCKEILKFADFDQVFPKVVLPADMEACKSLFRQANTQFKKALEVFVLDGYVTEHIEIIFSQSKLYKSLTLLEKSGERKANMLEKRRSILEPLLKELNPKAYAGTWQRILVEVSEVINDQYTLRVALLGAKGFPSEEKIAVSFELGQKSMKYYKEIVATLIEDKDTPRNQQFFQSIINSKINIAKAASKLMSSDRKQRVECLKQSWELYKDIVAYVNKEVPAEFRPCYSKEMELTQEMIAMLPNKIDKVNYGQLSFID